MTHFNTPLYTTLSPFPSQPISKIKFLAVSLAMTRVFEPREISLGWYSPKEIQEISCCEVSVPLSFDAFCHPVPDGLYDQRMGPLDAKQQCHTCQLSHLHCPGHFGHIVLNRQVLHPLLFDTLFSLIRSTCFKCGFFKITDHERLVYYTRLKALKRGVLLVNPDLFIALKNPDEIERELNSLEGSEVHTKEAHMQITSEFFRRYSQKVKCPRCMHRSSRITKGSAMRLYTNDRSFDAEATDQGDPSSQEYLSPGSIRRVVDRLFTSESALLEEFFGFRDASPFFVEVLPLVPNRFRPPRYSQGKVYENTTNQLLASILSRSVAAEGDERYWPDLQAAVFFYFDGSHATPPSVGLKQVIEKKEGLFRRNIMGKRVNYAARSVISPDPNLHTREVGVPHVFAKALTFPERVTAFNVDRLRGMVVRGAEYPGANFVQEGEALTSLAHISRRARLAAANQLGDGNKIVWRHLLDGDPVLLNRQPTLHAVSLMAHTVRVLRNENTLRIHYVNCKPYNADFDGDEMNIHLPQSYPAVSEATAVMHNDQNYFLPSAGRPIRGLEQDHVVAAARLTMKDTFLSPEEYAWVLQTGLPPGRRLRTGSPAILQPSRLYTGKQALSFVLHNQGATLNYAARTKQAFPVSAPSRLSLARSLGFATTPHESEVLVRDGSMLTGVLDKNTLGASPGSLIHACGELYGYGICNELLTRISRMVNAYIAMFGFTVRFDDLLMKQSSDETRRRIFAEAERSVLDDLTLSAPPPGFYHSDALCSAFDAAMRGKMNRFTSRVVELLEDGLFKASPTNNMENIIRTGAKGSIVNLSQICCALGQQELEGRRVPIMFSGKTLPCFRPCEWSPAAGGYVYERFLTGIDPATFFFHCMAGREGLVDTAVKTASSGYLQRCLVKHLEGLKVEYDLSVRNGPRIIQFRYGDDGIDCTKETFLGNHTFFMQNFDCVSRIADLGVDSGDILNEKARAALAGLLDGSASGCCGGTSSGMQETEFCEKFVRFLKIKYKLSEIDAGKSVGVIASQSIGEPSTQMTLNTFHLAGVGNKNVTLGIPRLSEILMSASKVIKTPMITVAGSVDAAGERERAAEVFSRVTLDKLLGSLTLTESTCQAHGEYKKRIKIVFELLKDEEQAAAAMDTVFLKLLGKEIKKRSSSVGIVDYANDNNSQPPQEEEREKSESESDVDSSATQENISLESSEESVAEVEEESEEVAEEKKLVHLKRISRRKYAFTVDYPANFSVWMMPLIEAVCKKTVVREIPGLRNASWNKNSLVIEGSDFIQLVKILNEESLDGVLDAYSAYSNDIYSVYTSLGVEAARTVIVREIESVFDVYGISINIRHLYLVADYMTRRGKYEPFSRTAFNMDDSFILKTSFESSYANLKKSALYADSDPLITPSSSVTVGNRMRHGTGSFDLWYKLDT